MTDKEYDKLKPGDIVIETRTGNELNFIKECIVILDPMELKLKGFDNLYNGVRRCEKYAVIEDANKIRTQIPLYNFINKYTIKEMENEIKIKVPEGKKAVQSTDDNGNLVIKFENAEPIRSKSWDEFCKNHSVIKNECYLSHYGSIIKYYNVTGCSNRDINEDKHLLETKEDAEGLLALIQLTRLHDEWVGDWKPKYEEVFDEKKYYITRYGHDTFKIHACWDYPHFLVFPTKKMAQEFIECFKDLLERAKRFI